MPRPKLIANCGVEGCGRAVASRGMCHPHYCRWYSNGGFSQTKKGHGHAKPKAITPEWRAWQNAKSRCYRPKDTSYKNYGARGIVMCDRWRNHFDNFLADMGLRPSKKHSLDRIDPNGNYEPENCRWATQLEQVNNRRDNRLLTFDGVILTLPEWGRLKGLKSATIRTRLSLGWPMGEILSIAASRGNNQSLRKR